MWAYVGGLVGDAFFFSVGDTVRRVGVLGGQFAMMLRVRVLLVVAGSD